MRTYSPSLSDSWTSSTQAQQQSPGVYARSLRPLPSPSSLATASHKPSWTGLGAPPGSSPTAGQQSIHSVTSSPAASQHISDLQHQVTLKSLALQTLQSEYTSLLQKFQRDRLRSQTFEKKTVAADQEINELTAKNEELADQVKSLEVQVEECERKRETERSESVRQKDQWGKMLEMSGRLQSKGAEDRQKLLQEKDDLQQRLQIHENEAALSASRKAPRKASPGGGADNHGSESMRSNMGVTDPETAAQVAVLQRDNAILQTRTGMLRSALERMEGQYAAILEKRREMMEQEVVQIPSAIAMALQEDSAFARPVIHHRSELRTGQGIASQQEKRPNPTEWSSPQPQESPQDALEPAKSRDRVTEGSLLSLPAKMKTNNATAAKPSPPMQQQSQPTPKAARPKLQTVPLPKWQPPSASNPRTDHITNNQRRPSGPATPYPGAESQPWQSFESMPAHPPSPGRRPSPTPLPVFASEKTPARGYTPHWIPPARNATDKSQAQDVAAAMPPPPRPASGIPNVSNASGPWRPSD